MHTHQKSSDPVATIGLDIGKNTFNLVGLDKRGALAMRTKLSRNQLIPHLANLSPCLIGLEAGSGSHHIAHQIKPLGHDVRLIPAQYVKPFLKAHKNDYRDGEAIAEAVQRPTMNFVAIKTPEQSDLLSLHRVRSRLVRQRTAIINQIRAFLSNAASPCAKVQDPYARCCPEVLSSPPHALSPRILRLIAELDQDWRRLDERLEALSNEIESLCKNDPACQRLMTVPGIGPIISSAVVASIATGSGFRQGRDFAAWLGLVPKQESTGGRTKLGRISKRGNKYLRTLFVQAAHVVLERRPATAMRALWPWIERASKRLAHRNLLATALANKLARIAWAVLARGRDYEPGITCHEQPSQQLQHRSACAQNWRSRRRSGCLQPWRPVVFCAHEFRVIGPVCSGSLLLWPTRLLTQSAGTSNRHWTPPGANERSAVPPSS
jgi:transposase